MPKREFLICSLFSLTYSTKYCCPHLQVSVSSLYGSSELEYFYFTLNRLNMSGGTVELSGSNTDGLFTMAVSNSCLSP